MDKGEISEEKMNLNENHTIPYKSEDIIEWKNKMGEDKGKLLSSKYPLVYKNLPKHYIEIIKNLAKGQLGSYFPEIKAMNYFIEKGHEVYLLPSAFVTHSDNKAKEIIDKYFTDEQKKLIYREGSKPRPGGLPDLLIGKNNEWWFVEVKTKRKGRPFGEGLSKTQKIVFPQLEKLGIKIEGCYLEPVKN